MGVIEVDLIVNSHVEFLEVDIPKKILREIRKIATKKDPQYAIYRRMGLPTWNMTPHIKMFDRIDQTYRVWRGLLGDIVRILKQHKIKYNLVDQRLTLPKIDLACSIKLRDYQIPALRIILKRQQTIFRGEAASGKTETLLAAASKFGQPTLVLVWQERQQKVWLERIPKYFDCEVGGIGGAFKTPKIAPITIGMVQSVRNRFDWVKDKFGCVLCDEVQRFAAKTLRTVVNSLPAKYRIGASDDERRRDKREFLLYGTFGPLGHRLQPGQGQADVNIIMVPTKFEYSEEDEWRLNWPQLVSELIEDDERNQLIINLAVREARENKRVIIWSDRVGHCLFLQKEISNHGISTGLLLGGVTRKEASDRAETGLRDGTILVGIGTKVAEQAVNIPPLEVGIMTCGSADKDLYRFRQMRGRLARPHKNITKTVYYLWDKNVFQLRNKIANIRRQYFVKINRYSETIEERLRMAEKSVVTLETMRLGSKALGLSFPSGTSYKKMESVIKRTLQKDKTYAVYACEACGRDIIDEIAVCPYCAGEFKIVEDEPKKSKKRDHDILDPENEEIEEEYEEDEETEDGELEEGDDGEEGEESEEDEDEETENDEDDEVEEGDEEEEEEDEVEEGDEEEEDDEEESEGDEEDEEEEESEGDEEEEESEEDEDEDDVIIEEKPKKKPKKSVKERAKELTKKLPGPRHGKDENVISKDQKIKILKEGIPYDLKKLKKMKHPTLVLLAKVLGLKKLASSKPDIETLIKGISKKQKKMQEAEGAKPKKASKKATKTPTKKTAKKKSTKRK